MRASGGTPRRWLLSLVISAGIFPGASFAFDLPGGWNAALDQPRINAVIQVELEGGTTDPLFADFFGTKAMNIQAYYDTGASGVLISSQTFNFLTETLLNPGVPLLELDGKFVVFEDVGVAGSEHFYVSQRLTISLASFHPNTAGQIESLEDMLNVTGSSAIAGLFDVYNQSFSNVRTQVGPLVPPLNPLLEGLDVFGMPTMAGKYVVMDPKPLDPLGNMPPGSDIFDLIELADTMRTYVYDWTPNPTFNPATADSDPGVPQTSHHVKLSYASFDRFTQLRLLEDINTEPPTLSDPLDPAMMAEFGPTLRNNPFIGPNPLLVIDGTLPPDDTPGIEITRGGLSMTGSWLFDTGAAASIISEQQAAGLGVTVVRDAEGVPSLVGVPAGEQYVLEIGGIGGTLKVPGFFLDTMTLMTMEGDPLVFHVKPVLVLDITVADPITGDELTLDGIFGMETLVASTFLLQEELFPGFLWPIFVDFAPSVFDWIVFDEVNGILGLDLKAEYIPEPSALALLAVAGLLGLRRPRRR